MVGVRTLNSARLFTGSQLRLLDAFAAGIGIWQHRNRDQYSRDHSLPAMPGHEAQPHAPAGVAKSRDGGNGSDCHHAAIRSPDHAADRPVFGRAFLRRAGRWLSGALDALLLDIWPP